MPSIGSITKTIRINAEDKAYIEKLMIEKGLTWSGAIHHIIGLTTVDKRFSEFEITAKCYGMGLDEFVEKINKALDDGDVVYEDGRFYSVNR